MNAKLNITDWQTKLGLFPMPLFQDKFSKEKFVLLNGGIRGNLCIDFKEEDINQARSYAWSSDVGQYLILNNEFITVYRWDTYNTNKYRVSEVAAKLNSFYDYLKKEEISKQDSVVKFSLQLYRQIRSLLRDNQGNESLNTLFYLFACTADNSDREKLKLKNWAISAPTKDLILSKINQSNWDELQETLLKGLQTKDLQPDINLILRHASGNLFQEAHFETIFPLVYQQALPLFLPKVDTSLEKKNRNQTSAHFTPTSIVRTIVEESIREYNFKNKKEITVLDPACGSGEFLKEFLRQIKLKNYNGFIKIIGWDISETAINMARFIINYEVQPYKEQVNITLETKDTLKDGKKWSINPDFILMNPPFISWELMSDEQRESVSKILGGLNNKRPNTASAFFWNAINCLNNGGVIGSVLPTSIFENETYIPLREETKDILDIKIVGRIGSHTLFSETLVDTAVFLGYKNKVKKNDSIVFWSDYKSESASTSLRELRKMKSQETLNIIDEKGFSIYKNSGLTAGNTWMPISYSSFELLNRLQKFPKVKELFDIKQGVRTGLNSVFIITKKYFEQLPAKEKKYFRPAVTNESIQNGQLNDNYYIFYAEGKYEISSIDELRKVVPVFYKDILHPNFKKLSTRARKGEHNFWRLSEHRAWQIDYTPKIVSKEFGNAGSFAFDKTGSFVAERSHAWLPKNQLRDDLGYAYICVLNMPIINDLLRGLAKQLGGGDWWYLSSKYINNMPLPNLFDSKKYNTGIIDKLSEIGVQMSLGKSVDEEELIKLSNIIFNG